MSPPTDTATDIREEWSTDDEVAERCCAFVDSTTDIFTHIRPDGKMGDVTDTEAMLGRTKAAFVETSLIEFIHPEDTERAVSAFETALDGTAPSPVELQFRHGDGHWI